MNKKVLWQRLRNYHFNHLVPASLFDIVAENFGGIGASTKAFAKKIAKKHDWEYNFALLAIKEYKKFVYLGVVGDFHVTPSKIIDVVWHEHLLFTDAYRSFCNEVIEYQFDHNPELIPTKDQTNKYKAQYEATIDLYIIEFGINPPEEIWDLTKFNFNNYNTIDTNKKNQQKNINDNSVIYTDEVTLHTYFDGGIAGNTTMGEFGGYDGGGSGGGGADGSWDTNDTGESSSADGGDSGGDGGGGCSGGCGD